MAGIYDGTTGSVWGGTAIITRVNGPNTGDKMILTADGQWWLLVQAFPSYRATGERRGIVRGQFVFDV